MKYLGIDLGTNSIGWAIRNLLLTENQIEESGVITFEKGVATEKGNEFPKVQVRTQSRGKRRNYQAEKYRKWTLLEFLIKKSMCPLTIEELNEWRKYKKGDKRKYPQSESFIQWLKFDFDGDNLPDFHLLNRDKNESHYLFRACVIDEKYRSVFERNPYILGRIFYQLVQRRGFRGRDEEEAKTMLQGSEKNKTKGRNEIAEYITKYKTLGAALYHYQKDTNERIRKRYNLRKDYEKELKTICDFYNFSEEDYKALWKSIIWQRPLRSQKGLVGNCIYETNKKRVAISHPLYEEYKTWIFINNLNIEPPKGVAKVDYLQKNIYPLFYRSTDFEIKNILEQLKRDGAEMYARFDPKTKVSSAKLLNTFQDVLGDNWQEKYDWNDIYRRDAQTKKKETKSYNTEDIWHILNTFDSQECLKEFALRKLNLSEEKAEKFSKIKLNQGYATLSLSAVKKMLPFLRKGFLYSDAVYLANLHKILGLPNLSDDLIETIASEIETIIIQNKVERTLNNVVNSLIQDELNEENRYCIENGRPLDKEECSKVKNKLIAVFGEHTWEALESETQDQYFNFVAEKFSDFLKKPLLLNRANLFVQQPRLHDQIFDFIQKKYQVSDDNKKFLWHPSEQENYKPSLEYCHFKLNGKDVYVETQNKDLFIQKHKEADFEGQIINLLGNPEPISKGLKNPMALKSLYKLKKLINYLLKEGKIDEDTRIIIEISRELNDANRRKAIEKWQKEREKENETFKKKIDEINKECGTSFNREDKKLIQKIRLWEEQGRRCIYTGKTINLCDVFDGNKYDIEHTIPASISFDSELKNLTLSSKWYNNDYKGKKFPAQLGNYEEEKTINGIECGAIIKNIEAIFGKRKVEYKKDKKGNIEEIVSWEKIAHLEKLYKEWKNKASYASTKDIKDSCIQNYHKIKNDLDYLKAKLHTFTLTEYKAGWKNSQLRDTQIITKYALPYLKTLFRRVSVEKPSVVNGFKEIYQVKFISDKKDRTVHSHHAIDAAILTLIPPHYDRDRILKKYNEYKDNRTGKVYHEKPKNWENFNPSYLLNIENEILINNIVENKTLLQTYKTVRKKGKVVWLNKEKGIKKIAQGDTIRGQLHGESFYGAIKQPIRDENGKILFDEHNKMILDDKIYIVKRRDLLYKTDSDTSGFKSLDEIEKVIVDKNLFKMIKKQVEASDFKTALIEGVYMLDTNGNKVGQKIRRIRCFENLKYENIIKVHQHAYASDKEYKQHTLATNGENTYCLFYKNEFGKAMQILSIVDLADLKIKSISQIWEEPAFLKTEIGKGKNKKEIPLHAILKSGDKVIFYKENMHELKDLDIRDISKRMFKVYQFESDGRMKFRHHLAAGIDTELKKQNKECSSINFDEKQVFLRISQAQWNFAIEGIDFEMTIDGKIHWLI